MEKQKIHLSRLEPDIAAAMLGHLAHLDPRGLATPDSITAMSHAGQCFAATSGQDQAVYVVTVKNGVAWVDAAKGEGATPWGLCLLPIIEAQAKGCRAVSFQTRRRGLVRTAQKQGYTVSGWILSKALP